MDLLPAKTPAALAETAASRIADLIAARPDAAVVVATGNTPLATYRVLGERVGRGDLDASRLRVFQLDEYLGLGHGDDRSLYGWMARAFLHPLGIPERNAVRLPSGAVDPDAACRAYDAAVRDAGGFDLAILGLGPNGHLGFNEPPSDRAAPTRVVTLSPESVASNAAYWGGDPARVPRQALTAGMDLLLAARHTLLLVSGAPKRAILRRALDGPPTADVPASWLHLAPKVTVVADRAALTDGAP
ncbi:MAG: Glucosamine-6-phosphate deaminase [uncultured Thermomicrobiales bacterium]|uniref:Glucosamine-6-phosphate deaminase n=1 Tax=uncultured Thermomicrobiales bacterium TaxID=1645740 RepID=A0A6J4U604_9BACT|nr:MAG: Glucosamine-6-phosphate deaminase [uncultured Thermomicrobiales bacterium]